ncbi:unnamed protein product [Polarella glacialis]|uniref:Uncharacterized protein n=2 Tax=Polarella glacialis TaxID=89957 RepID=A0A813HPR5_POLGL|nr:unnamed protein product [Polarella glacialis]
MLTLIRPETSAPGCGPLLRPGAGAAYEVVFDRVAIRSAPTVHATTLEVKPQGSLLELFDWDDSRLWRRCPADLSGTTAGWAMLDHPEFGPLLRPKGSVLCVRPLEPLCVAAAEGRDEDLQRFLAQGLDANVRNADGLSPLMLASQAGALNCVVHLLEARAVSSTSVPGTADAMELASSTQVRSLLEALLGQGTPSTSDEAVEALGNLSLAARLAADRIMEELAEAEAQISEVRPRADILGAALLPAKKSGGTLYEVNHKAVAIRYLPSVHSEIVGTRIRGQTLTLFEADASGRWRRFDSDGCEEGWVLLHHHELGDLVRPVHREAKQNS